METKRSFEDINKCFDDKYSKALEELFDDFIVDLAELGFTDTEIDLSVKISSKSGDSKIGTTKKISIY